MGSDDRKKRSRFLRGSPTSLIALATVITLSTLAACGGDDEVSTAQPNDASSVQPTQNTILPTAGPVVETDPSSVAFEEDPDLVDSNRDDISAFKPV